MTHRRLSRQELETAEKIKGIFSQVFTGLVAANAEHLEVLFSGECAALILDRAARERFGFDLKFPNVDDIEAIVEPRNSVAVIAKELGAMCGVGDRLGIGVVSPTEREVLPMFAILWDMPAVDFGRVTLADPATVAPLGAGLI